MSEQKTRRAINISLQAKQYLDSVNSIVNTWEKNGLNISTEACESILLVNKIKNISTISELLKILNTLETLSHVYKYDNDTINDIIDEIVIIDNSRFSEILAELNMNKFTNAKKERKTNKKIPETFKEIELEEKPSKKILKKQKIEERKIEEISEDINVPEEFLWNE